MATAAGPSPQRCDRCSLWRDPGVSSSLPPSDPQLIAQLRQSLGMLQVAFDAATDAMLIIDADRRIHWANQAAAALLLQRVPIAVMNRQLADLLTLTSEQGSQPATALLDPGVALPARPDQGRFRLRRPDGSLSSIQRVQWQPVELVRAPFLLISLRDLGPEEKALQQQQQFMVDLTHELRTPLAIVTGSLQRLSRLEPMPSQVSAGLAMARQEVDRIHRLLENLSLMTRLDVDTECLGLADHELHALLATWRRQLPESLAQRLHPEFDSAHRRCAVRVDANAFQLVMDQLLDNALRFGATDQLVEIRAEPGESDEARVTVASIGSEPPVEAAVLRRWQQPFQRGVGLRDGHQVEGPGLGLALVRQLVQAWGGGLTLQQQVMAAGTCTAVTFTIPNDRPEAPPTAEAGAQTDPV